MRFSAWFTSALVLLALGCPSSRTPEASCTDACVKNAKERCDEDQCRRGCAFILDRIVEREHMPVIACVARRTGSATVPGGAVDAWRDGRCGDREWAECAVLVGVHADGGPGAPPPVDERPTE